MAAERVSSQGQRSSSVSARAVGHFVHVGFWVEIVRVVISPSELLGELFAHRRLTTARYAH